MVLDVSRLQSRCGLAAFYAGSSRREPFPAHSSYGQNSDSHSQQNSASGSSIPHHIPWHLATSSLCNANSCEPSFTYADSLQPFLRVHMVTLGPPHRPELTRSQGQLTDHVKCPLSGNTADSQVLEMGTQTFGIMP